MAACLKTLMEVTIVSAQPTILFTRCRTDWRSVLHCTTMWFYWLKSVRYVKQQRPNTYFLVLAPWNMQTTSLKHTATAVNHGTPNWVSHYWNLSLVPTINAIKFSCQRPSPALNSPGLVGKYVMNTWPGRKSVSTAHLIYLGQVYEQVLQCYL